VEGGTLLLVRARKTESHHRVFDSYPRYPLLPVQHYTCAVQVCGRCILYNSKVTNSSRYLPKSGFVIFVVIGVQDR
jgi:hypothetical protein